MSDMKSKLPDLKELASMTGKLFNDIKTSVTEIIHDYKEVRAQASTEEKTPEEQVEVKVKKPKAAPKSADEEPKE